MPLSLMMSPRKSTSCRPKRHLDALKVRAHVCSSRKWSAALSLGGSSISGTLSASAVAEDDLRMHSRTISLFILCLIIAVAAPAAANSQLGPVTGFVSDLFNNIIRVVDAGIKEGMAVLGRREQTLTPTPAEGATK
ncbi:uncharacterized protein [Dermacentor albipictus]|uniref:uncharacterized protein n=1 Tax=Dermacentor albipictus TaxID=60249 RepID=UPI0031FBFA58